MYDLPSRDDIAKCLVDEDVVVSKALPTLITRADAARQNRPRRAAS